MARRYGLPLILGITVAAVTATVACAPGKRQSRSVAPATVSAVASSSFDSEQSAALFVGVRTFSHDATLEVPYAVDDAVDLAYMFALDCRVKLVRPRNVVLALAGDPQKDESKKRLRELKEAGALEVHADQGRILEVLKAQADLAGPDGMLILSFATHGYNRDGVSYLLAARSNIDLPETTLSAASIYDIASRSRAGRSLILVDACRERLTGDSRSLGPDDRTAATMIRRMRTVHGQVILSAAAPGGYAYDDHVHKNGVFTHAVLEGLDCQGSSPRDIVTAASLHTYVERNVLEWIKKNRDKTATAATQVSMDGDSGRMPLSLCWVPPIRRLRVTTDGSTVTALDLAGKLLWKHDMGGGVVGARVVDLDADGAEDVVVGIRGGETGQGALVAFDTAGNRQWSKGEGLTLQAFVVADLKHHRNAVVALWNDEHSPASLLTVHDKAGVLTDSVDYRGHLLHVVVDRPTNRHDSKIIVAAASEGRGERIFALHPNKLSGGGMVWSGVLLPHGETIARLGTGDYDQDDRRDISVDTTNGGTLVLDFDGKVLARHAGQGPRLDFALPAKRRR
jgi:hypothetical protein